MAGLEKIEGLMRSSGLVRKNGYSIKKLMVIVDEEHLFMLDELMMKKKWGVQVVYIVTDSPVVRSMFPQHSRIYPLRVNIRNLLRFDIIDEIVCCISSLPKDYLNELQKISGRFGVSLLLQTGLEHKGIKAQGKVYLADYQFNAVEANPGRNIWFIMKSGLEMAFAFTALFMLSPFLLFISLAVTVTSPGPVFFKQQRVGLRGRKFYIYKFRTMVVDAEKQKHSLSTLNEADGPAFKMADDPRITGIGKILRKTGIDEIPQLFNVMKGEMSLIGPRPMLPDEVAAQEEWQLKRMCIKPGITCTWQIQPQRNKVPFKKWMELDRDYIENWSLSNDMKIFFRTIKTVLSARGL